LRIASRAEPGGAGCVAGFLILTAKYTKWRRVVKTLLGNVTPPLAYYRQGAESLRRLLIKRSTLSF
jgi:hypothetical protein